MEWAADAELVAFGVGESEPPDGNPTDAGTRAVEKCASLSCPGSSTNSRMDKMCCSGSRRTGAGVCDDGWVITGDASIAAGTRSPCS